VTPLERRVRNELRAVDGLVESADMYYDGDAFWANGKEVAYVVDDGARVGLRLTRREISARRAELRADDRVELKQSSDWLHVHVRAPGDVRFVGELARVAAKAHLPANGTAPAPPPSGAKLERMRRFH
jgi:hypothetical protein